MILRLFSQRFSLFSLFCLYQLASFKKTMPNSLNSRRALKRVDLEKVDLQKRVLMYPMSSVYQAASKNRGESFLWNSEYSWVDWKRGIIENCSQFQDHKILLHR